MIRALLWVEARRGRGHLSVVSQLARALVAVSVEPHLVCSRFEELALLAGNTVGIHLHTMPPISARPTELLAVPGPCDRKRRRRRLLEVASFVEPDVVLFEMWPMRRAVFDDELVALSRHLDGVPVVSLVRDVCGKPAEKLTDAREKAYSAVEHLLVRGDGLIRLEETWSCPQLVERALYVGYFHDGFDRKHLVGPRRDWVFAMGGGWFDDARELVRATAAAFQAFSHPTASCHVFVPPALVDGLALGRRVRVEPPSARYQELLPACELAVVQAGYNSVLDALARDRAAVLFPARNRFTGPEQAYRLARLEDHGCVGGAARYQVALEPQQIMEATRRALDGGEPSRTLSVGGAETAAQAIAAVARNRNLGT